MPGCPSSLLLLLAASASAPVAGASFPITHGRPTDGDAAVVALLDAAGTAFCTGTLVAPARVLTAAHCLAPTAPALAGVFVGSDPGADRGVVLEVAATRTDPGYDAPTWRRDLGVVELRSSAPASIVPLALHPEPLTAERLGGPARLVGFGAAPDDDLARVRKRTGRGRLRRIDDSFVHLVPDPSQPCLGDSGGPVLLAVDGVERIVGVVSHGDLLCAAHAYAARVDVDAAPFLHEGDPGPAGCSSGGASGRMRLGPGLPLVLLVLYLFRRVTRRTP